MKTIVYNIHTNLPCGEVLDGDSPKNEIIRNAIPNFGGTEKDYSYIEVSGEDYEKFSKYEFSIVDGQIVFSAEKVIVEPLKEPSLDDYLLDLDFRLSTVELGL